MEGQWIEIFRGGKQTDSQGVEHDADRLIDQAVATFDPKRHEPPAVIGHPADNAPAWAWVDGLKTEWVNNMKTLFARFKDVVPEFAELLNKKMFKKRSASFYPDGRLRHVGFLGAMPPAVKGLADIAYNEAEQAFDFDQPTTFSNERTGKMDVKDFFEGLKFWRESIPQQPAPKTEPAKPTEHGGAMFTEADIEAARKTAAEEASKKAAAEARKAVDT